MFLAIHVVDYKTFSVHVKYRYTASYRATSSSCHGMWYITVNALKMWKNVYGRSALSDRPHIVWTSGTVLSVCRYWLQTWTNTWTTLLTSRRWSRHTNCQAATYWRSTHTANVFRSQPLCIEFLAIAGIYCTISPPLSGVVDDCSIVQVQQSQMLYRRRCRMSSWQRMFSSLWNAAAAHEHRRQECSKLYK